MRYAILLRGINVGGNRKIKMADLRQSLESAGFEDVATYIQSGNIVVTTDRKAAGVAKIVRNVIDEEFGFDVTVIVRSVDEWRDIRAKSPFAEHVKEHANKVIVMFADTPIDRAAVEDVLEEYDGPEEVVFREDELFVWFPEGQGRSKFPTSKIERALGVGLTARNWNAIEKMWELLTEA